MTAAADPLRDDTTLVLLRSLAASLPTTDAVLARIAVIQARLTLKKGTVHVVSDVHGEFKKLKHIVNNASGSIRPLVERTLGARVTGDELTRFLSVIYYPGETWEMLVPAFADRAARHAFVRQTIHRGCEVLRALARDLSLDDLDAALPAAQRTLWRELLLAPPIGRDAVYVDRLLDAFLDHDRDLDLLRLMARAIRNLSVRELIVAGDLGDRGPRIDKVIDWLQHQPRVRFTWGNHDASWIGACLGQRACVATVARISLRYRRLSQLEEGYGIPFAPVEKLARTVYGDDPATRFACKGSGLRDPLEIARMQKAMAIIQFKIEGQTTRAHPAWGLDHRNLLHRIDQAAGTVAVDGHAYPMLDRALPTVNPEDPYALSPDEEACIARLTESFVRSPILWEHMGYVVRNGSMSLVRDDAVIFHGCIPTQADGAFATFDVDGRPASGRALLDAFETIVRRAWRDKAPADLDWLWYLWSGPMSPCFGKDRMATFESYFIADPKTWHETKDPYFTQINDRAFCQRIAAAFAADPERALIVNGHMPVRVEKGEAPVKRDGFAVTIDGAFSEAYGDRGYTLVLESGRTALAEHHHFDSIAAAVTGGADIIPTVTNLRIFDPPRLIGDTEEGDALRQELVVLQLLLRAYGEQILIEQHT